MPDIRAVVFDFGGVVFDWSAEYLYRELIPDETQRKWFLSEVCTPAWNLQQDGGRTVADAEAELIAKHPDHADLIKAFYGQWPKTLRGVLQDGVDLVEQLHAAGVPLYGLTNWSAETFPYVEARYDFLKRFRHIVVSGRIKMLKPEARIYAHLMQQIGGKPEDSVFIDDALHNVEGARKFGMHAIHHRPGGALETAAELRKMGVKF
jgi:2-haloacid dehalogenase